MAIDLAESADQQLPEPGSLGCLKDQDYFARNRPTNVHQISLQRPDPDRTFVVRRTRAARPTRYPITLFDCLGRY